MSTALAPRELLPAAASWADKVKITETSLEIDTALTFDEWSDLGDRLGTFNRWSSWAIGDWLLEGFSQFGDRYTEAEKRTGMSRERLYRLRYVAEKVDSSVRRAALTFDDHEVVAPLPRDEQDHWLQLAENQGWDREHLIDQIRAAGSRASRPVPIRFSLVLPPTEQERAEKWRHAAEETGLEFGEWAAQALDQAAQVIDA